jgi:hypothetical protein
MQFCRCGEPLVVRQAKGGARIGESYYSCPNWKSKESPGCGFFNWVNNNQPLNNKSNDYAPQQARTDFYNFKKPPAQNQQQNSDLKPLVDRLHRLVDTLERMFQQNRSDDEEEQESQQ